MKCLALLISIISIFSCGTDDSGAYQQFAPDYSHPSAYVLDVPYYPQQTEVWCWAAVIEMVSDYNNVRALQCVTLQYWYGYDCCNYPSYCYTTGTEYQIQQSLYVLGIQSAFYTIPLSWDDFVFEIDNGQPIIMFYRNSFSGHVVVGFGYNDEKNTIFIHDPYYGTFEVPFGVSFSYNGSMMWVQTLAGFTVY